MKTESLERLLGYQFKDCSQLVLALTHRSSGKNNNERLEFLGDSLLNFIIGEKLCVEFPEAREGDLTRVRSSLVKGDTLAEIAIEFSLGDYLVLGDGERKSGGFRRVSILGDAVEAIIGAIYLEAGMDICRDCVLRWFSTRLAGVAMAETGKDPKTRLQEFMQLKKKSLPTYQVIDTGGTSHSTEFTVECRVALSKPPTIGQGSSKRVAEKQAAEKMLKALGLVAL